MKKTIKQVFVTTSLATMMFTSSSILNQISIVYADNTSSSQIEQVSSSSSNQSSSLNNVSSISNQSSNNSGQAIQKKELTKPYIVFGAGLSQSQQNAIEQVLLGNNDNSTVTELTATASDYNQYINNGQPSNTTNASMISSVAISPADPGSGIKVAIKDFNGQNNIQQVTQQQYAMVAQMAGVTDINIVVSANIPVSGTSALTGVYEALANDGIKLNNQNTSAANGVLAATQPAIQANQNDKTYPGKLMQAVGQTANQIAKDNQNNQTPSQQQIQDMLNHNLEEQGIKNKTPQNIIVNIGNSLNTFKSTPVAQTKQFTQGMDNTLNNIKNSLHGDMLKAQDWITTHQGFFENIWNHIKMWWNDIKNWWKVNVMHEQIQNNSVNQN